MRAILIGIEPLRRSLSRTAKAGEQAQAEGMET